MLAAVWYDSPDARRLTQALHREQVATYARADDPEATEAAEFEPPSGVFLLAARADGTALACGGWRTAGPTTAEIKRMYVTPAIRGHGLARQLLEALEHDARQHGMSEAILKTGVSNLAALTLYIRCGYTLVAPYAPGRDPRINRALSKALGTSAERAVVRQRDASRDRHLQPQRRPRDHAQGSPAAPGLSTRSNRSRGQTHRPSTPPEAKERPGEEGGAAQAMAAAPGRRTAPLRLRAVALASAPAESDRQRGRAP
ncbi:GNAT family N-acetyltransferase [Streptomyces sp. NPDC001279]|uniref:GNAT family N-acetyltransferase n=1 Tax=Streptomyces sp. NPDC001279 TaxID=3364556 RepID=UPI00367C8307